MREGEEGERQERERKTDDVFTNFIRTHPHIPESKVPFL